MVSIEADYTIRITRGDTATLEFAFAGDPPGENDRVISALKKSVYDEESLWVKELQYIGSDGTGDGRVSYFRMKIASEDTMNLAKPQNYWDLRVLYENGDITTPFESAQFKVSEAVTGIPVDAPGEG